MARRTDRLLAQDDVGLSYEGFGEAPRARRRRLKSRSGERRVQEVDRSESVVNLERAAKRLKIAHASERVLCVPQWNMEKAIEAMKRAGVSGVVTNLCGTKKQRVESAARRKNGVVS